MKISGDMAVKLALGAVVAGGTIYLYFLIKKAGGALYAAIPQTVKNGAEAAGKLAGLGVDIATSPLQTFGVVATPGKTELTVPWEANYTEGDISNDPVSNNASGINYNLF